MLHFTAKQFKLKYGIKPGYFFNLNAHITPEHQTDCIANPTVAILRSEFGIIDSGKDTDLPLYYRLDVRWWFEPIGSRMRGLIDNVIMFKSKEEMMADKKRIEAQAIKLNQN